MRLRHRLVVLAVLCFLSAAATALSQEARCTLCGFTIPAGEKYYQFRDGKEIYCSRCYAQAPRCSICKLPTAAADLDSATGACPGCLAKLPRCAACKKPISGNRYTYPPATGVYCADCKNNRPPCYVCGLPVGDDHWTYPDGRITCNACTERAVFEIDEISRIMQEAQSTVEARVGLKIRHPYTLRVERLNGSSTPRRNLTDKVLPGQSPLYGKELGIYRLEEGRSEIFLLFGLPPEMLFETAAHEYAHAWQAENCPLDLPAELREGFAQWVAAEVLRAKGFRSALGRLESRRDFPYGTGYQRLKGLAPRRVLEYCIMNR